MKPLVFLHGWGQSKQVWYQQHPLFDDALYLNLPGCGGEAESDNWLQTLEEQLPEQCIIIGWSLGGLLTMQLAEYAKDKVAALVLVSSTPCFCHRHDWLLGCSDEVFQGFENGIASQSAKTMSRFFALMFQGDDLPRSTYNQIAKHAVDKKLPPSSNTLFQGLKKLSKIDIRTNLHHITQPVLIMHGDADSIVPFAVSAYLAEHLPQASLQIFNHCGHAPFLTQADTFNSSLEAWCQTI